MRISSVSDEVSSDPETAFELIHSWGVEFVELRYFGEERFPQVSAYWQERMPRLLDEFHLRVSSISPGIFYERHPVGPGEMDIFRATDARIFRQAREAE